jgi:hypothetical protein
MIVGFWKMGICYLNKSTASNYNLNSLFGSLIATQRNQSLVTPIQLIVV